MPKLNPEQEKIVNHDKGDILCSASAGSGKTFVMIERIIKLIVDKKTTVDKILAVTFTEAAASEMKEKLKDALIKKFNEGSDQLIGQINDVYVADISTVHSFCSKLVRTYFYVAGVSPDFAIADESVAEELKNDALNKVFRDKYVNADEQFKKILKRFIKNRSDEDLKEYVLSIYNFIQSEAEPEKYYQIVRENYSNQNFNQILLEYKREIDNRVCVLKERALELFNNFKQLELKKSAEFCLSLVDDLELILKNDLLKLAKIGAYERRLSFEQKLVDYALECKNYASEIRDEIKKIRGKITRFCSINIDENTLCNLRETNEFIIDLVSSFDVVYSQSKRDENLLDFNDLEHFALKVLSDSEVRSAIKEKYDYIFVDEYQDTNGTQEAILTLIKNDNLFMVGDVKQSIYAFRGCRPDIFASKRKKMLENNQSVSELNNNFRSSDAVIDTVNSVFSYCMTEKQFGIDYANTSTLKSGGKYGDAYKGRSEIHFLKKDTKSREYETPRIYDVLNESNSIDDKADNISALITKIITEEREKTYYSVKEEKEKPVTFSDIVILTRNRQTAFVSSLVNSLLRRGIDISSEVKQNICSCPEIQVLIKFLELLDCFSVDIPLATVMKSEIGEFSEEDLAEIVLFFSKSNDFGGFYDAYDFYLNNASGELHNRVACFDAYIKNMRLLADFIGAKGILEKVIFDTEYVNKLLATVNGQLKVKRVKRFVSLAGHNNGSLTVLEMLDKISHQKQAFNMSFTSEENTVRLMTIHSSKGLEFPVVIVTGLEKQTDKEKQEEIIFDRSLGFAVKYYDDQNKLSFETPLRGYIKERNKKNTVAEEMRLLYVALTRAQYSLHVTFECINDVRKDRFDGASRFIDYIPRSLPVTVHQGEELDFYSLSQEYRPPILSNVDEKMAEEMKANFDKIYPFTADTSLKMKDNVTRLTKESSKISIDENKKRIAINIDTSADKGSLAHKFLELVDFDNLFDLNAEKQRIINSKLMSEEQFNMFDLSRLQNAVNTDIFKLLNGGEIYKEQGFIVSIPARELYGCDSDENVLVQGIIDLLCIKGDEAIIIDYKYSHKTPEGLIDTYKTQLELYSKAVSKVLNKKVVKKAIVNIFDGQTVVID